MTDAMRKYQRIGFDTGGWGSGLVGVLIFSASTLFFRHHACCLSTHRMNVFEAADAVLRLGWASQ